VVFSQLQKVITHQTKLPNAIQHGKYKKQLHHHQTDHNSEQLWEKASKFVQQQSAGQHERSHKLLPYQSELTSARTVKKRSKTITAVHSYNKPSTVSQVAKWLTDQYTQHDE